MYKNNTNTYIYSPSDLTLFLRSPFASWMARLELDYPDRVTDIKKDQDPMNTLLAAQGENHERRFLEELKVTYGSQAVVEITVTNKEAAYEETLIAMQAGSQFIFQAYLTRDNFAGSADFLVKREGKSQLGDYYYEAWDTKFSKSTRPYFVIQLCCYSWMLEAIQGRLPEEVVVVLGNGKEEKLRIAAYYSYFLNLKNQFLEAQAAFTGDPSSMPDPALCKDYGVWSGHAQQLMAQSDSLALVANIRKSQVKKLQAVGIETLSQLANTPIPSVKGISPETFLRLKMQADIQLQSRGQEKPCVKILDNNNGKGLASLPPKSSLDVFFDLEGHPLLDGGLEYLWGVSFSDAQAKQGKHYAFKDWWAHDQEQEKLAFQSFIDWVYARWQQDSAMHIYHYASYEITAINKLSNRYQTRQEQVAELLKNGVFVDLYKIVKNGLLIGEPKYSIKNVEHLYREKRMTEVGNGGESVVVYENWREAGGVEDWSQRGFEQWRKNPDGFDWSQWPILKAIRDYNIDDCESTLELVDWLRGQQVSHGIRYSPRVTKPVEDDEKNQKQLDNAAKWQALAQRQQALIDRFEADSQLKQDPHAGLLVSLLHFHDRERKVKAWAYYERLEKTDDELFDDDTVVHDITDLSTQTEAGKIKCFGRYNSDQPIRTDKIKSAMVQGCDVKVSDIKFADIDEHHGGISFTMDANHSEALKTKPFTLFGNDENINTENLENRLCEITEQYFKDRVLAEALANLLSQAVPRFKHDSDNLPITRQRYPDNTAYLDAIINAVENMNNTCLCIQGPPGAGKTYTAQKVIMALVNQNKRIGIMANSHDAIMNLLMPVAKSLPEMPIAKVGGYGNNQATFLENYPVAEYPSLVYRTSMGFTQRQPYDFFRVVGGTAFSFAKDVAYETPLDFLFIDEASQVALANLVAVSGAAKNFILMGDQMQLEQPTQGSHPGQSGSSALEFMLKEHAVILEDKGIFLERTFRMHPAVCEPLSEVVYEGKLTADDDNHRQAVAVPQPRLITQANGVLSITVQHEGNTQSSIKEVDVVQQLIDELKTGQFTDKQGKTRPITDQDILVIAPYNMQVNLLKEKLRGDLKIGTIDKFQGQEAPVVIISMAVSDVDDSPRGLDFVFDINRLNVAISRAKAVAIVVANQGLKQCSVSSLGQMEKVGLFCKLTLIA